MQFGELEKLILQYLWANEPADVKKVYEHFKECRGGSLNTYQTTLDRLYRKSMLSRQKKGYAYWYTTKVDRSEFIFKLVNEVTSDLVSNGDESSLVVAFGAMSKELDENQLDKLESLIALRRQNLEECN